MEHKQAKKLFIKYKEGLCTEEEIALLESWYLEYQYRQADFNANEVSSAKNEVWASLPVHKRNHKKLHLRLRMAVAASVFVCMAIGLVIYQSDRFKNEKKLSIVIPGGNKAVLTLADGTKIDLNTVSNGTLAKQSGISVDKTADGKLVYSVVESENQLKTEFNSIETPRGGQYQISLPDGTKVWLNASSTIKYPTSFDLAGRKVELHGEAYFEVVHNEASPFQVLSNGQMVTVLGTRFNVSAYQDDHRTVTTLLQGKVKVQLDDIDVSVGLNPGEQSIIVNRTLKVRTIENDDAIAWKNNTFVFNNEELGSIMRKVSRWYDIDVVCPPHMAKMIFAGTVSRTKNIQQVLQIMELTGTVHFKLEGRRITVMP